MKVQASIIERTAFLYEKGQTLELEKAFFQCVKTCRSGYLLDTVFFFEPTCDKKESQIFSFAEMKEFETEFYLRNPKKWVTYRTLRGLIRKLNSHVQAIK